MLPCLITAPLLEKRVLRDFPTSCFGALPLQLYYSFSQMYDLLCSLQYLVQSIFLASRNESAILGRFFWPKLSLGTHYR